MATPPAPPPKPAPAAQMRPAPPRPRPISLQDFKAFSPPPAAYSDQQLGLVGEVATFDPVARAALISSQMPRRWSGEYRPFDKSSTTYPVQLSIASAVPAGQMVVIRGDMRIGDVTSPIQGNLNAKSDQLDLLLLGDRLGGEIEPGAEIMGLQGLKLSGLRGPRLTTMGGRLQLIPAVSKAQSSSPTSSKSVIRGLW